MPVSCRLGLVKRSKPLFSHPLSLDPLLSFSGISTDTVTSWISPTLRDLQLAHDLARAYSHRSVLSPLLTKLIAMSRARTLEEKQHVAFELIKNLRQIGVHACFVGGEAAYLLGAGSRPNVSASSRALL